MSSQEMQQMIGQVVTIQVEGLTVECVVRDWKSAYGNQLVRVEPVAGSGGAWVRVNRVQERGGAS